MSLFSEFDFRSGELFFTVYVDMESITRIKRYIAECCQFYDVSKSNLNTKYRIVPINHEHSDDKEFFDSLNEAVDEYKNVISS